MEQTITIHIRNNDATIEAPMGSNLSEIYQLSGLQMNYNPISARVNNKVEGMHYRAYKQKEVEFSMLPPLPVHGPTPAVSSSYSVRLYTTSMTLVR